MKDFQIQAIGLMSGTSLDGLDVCCCTFRQQAGKWSFHIDCAKGYSYPDAMKQILGTGAQTMSALEFITFHSSYGKFLGERVRVHARIWSPPRYYRLPRAYHLP